MAKRSKQQDEDSPTDSIGRAVRAIERLGMVIGALAANQFGDGNLAAKANRFRRMGFSNVEIAAITASTPNTIAVALHRKKKGRGGRKKPAARKRS